MTPNGSFKLSWWQKKKRSIIKRLLIDFVNSSGTYVIQQLPDFFSKTDINLSELREYWIYQNKDNNDKDLIRLLFLITTVEELKKSNILWSLAEVGVYRGNSAKVLNSLCPERDLYLFDTFTGFDEKDCESENADPGGFSNTSIGQVRDFIGTQDNIHYLQGYFPETTSQLDPDARFALVHIDVDLYQPTKACLEYVTLP